MEKLKLKNLAKTHTKGTHWTKEKKLQCVAQYLALGNMRVVSATTGVGHDLLRAWKREPWWEEYVREIRNAESIEMDANLSKIVQKSLEAVADRLEHGEHFLNNKTGEVQRKPVLMKDAAKVANDLISKRELLRGNATSRTEQQAVPMKEQLAMLAQQFALFATAKPGEVIDVDVLDVTPKEDYDDSTASSDLTEET